MMPDRKMFWRIIRRLLGANRGRLSVILLALGSGAAITAALLNLQMDAKRRLTTVFRVLGANVIVAPSEPGMSAESPQLPNASPIADLSAAGDLSTSPQKNSAVVLAEHATTPQSTVKSVTSST